ncbi:uncharacterized protein LOC127698230 isoform X2 [Mytilus californianus]|uniref:uncharacterized protein LOC127698230 isoform X2 n=1 Tax=Mytilus californianus TaxID=6549 RepID=UPI0022457132|nr:uncharacterized protein LOC127698230 isoform X2 [Mytilus californianus]
MNTDFCNGCTELVGPPPIPPPEFLPQDECHDIISTCQFLSSQKSLWSNFSEDCLHTVTVSTATLTTTEKTTRSSTENIVAVVTQKYPQLVTGIISTYTTFDSPVFNVTKSPQSLFYAGFPAWLIGVIVVAVLAIIIVVVIIVACIIKKAKGERCLLNLRKVFSIQFLTEKRLQIKRSNISRWISSHSKWSRCFSSQCWKKWPRCFSSQSSMSSHHIEKENPRIDLPDIIQEQQSPSSSSPLTYSYSDGSPTIQLDIATEFCVEVFKEIEQSRIQNTHSNKDSNNYCEFIKNDAPSIDIEKQVNKSKNREIIACVNVINGERQLGDNSMSNRESLNHHEENKDMTKIDRGTFRNEDLKEKLEHLAVSSDDIVLCDTPQSLTVDSGYASRQVSKDNCSC